MEVVTLGYWVLEDSIWAKISFMAFIIFHRSFGNIIKACLPPWCSLTPKGKMSSLLTLFIHWRSWFQWNQVPQTRKQLEYADFQGVRKEMGTLLVFHMTGWSVSPHCHLNYWNKIAHNLLNTPNSLLKLRFPCNTCLFGAHFT